MKQNVLKIEDKSKGFDQIVKIITTREGKYALKVPRERILLFREEFACKKLKGKVPVPEIVFKNRNFLIEKYIEGKDLDEVKLTRKQEEKIYFEAGKMLRKIHKVKTKGLGFIGFDEKGVDNFIKKNPLWK